MSRFARKLYPKMRRSFSTVLDPMKLLVPVRHSNFKSLALHAFGLCRAALADGKILAIRWPIHPMSPGSLRLCAELSRLSSSNHLCVGILLGLADVFRLAQVAPVIFVGAEGLNLFTLRSQPQIRRDDREDAVFCEQRKDARRNYMN